VGGGGGRKEKEKRFMTTGRELSWPKSMSDQKGQGTWWPGEHQIGYILRTTAYVC
jgi:hypothetical protein